MGEWDPNRSANEQSALLKFRREDNWGPKPPKRRAGDMFIVVGSIVGMVIGGVVGLLLNIVMALIALVVAGVAGAFVGSMVESSIRRRRKARAEDSGSH